MNDYMFKIYDDRPGILEGPNGVTADISKFGSIEVRYDYGSAYDTYSWGRYGVVDHKPTYVVTLRRALNAASLQAISGLYEILRDKADLVVQTDTY